MSDDILLVVYYEDMEKATGISKVLIYANANETIEQAMKRSGYNKKIVSYTIEEDKCLVCGKETNGTYEGKPICFSCYNNNVEGVKRTVKENDNE